MTCLNVWELRKKADSQARAALGAWEALIGRKKARHCLSKIVKSPLPKSLPRNDLVFRAFELTRPKSVRVVIVGQDPYPDDRATGLAFSVPRDCDIPRSLTRILPSWRKKGASTIVPITATSSGAMQLEAVLSTIVASHLKVLIVRSDPMFFGERQRLAELANAQRLLTIFERREYSDAGGLLAYGPSLMDQFRRAAFYVDKILKGAEPAVLPIEQPTKFELVINLNTS